MNFENAFHRRILGNSINLPNETTKQTKDFRLTHFMPRSLSISENQRVFDVFRGYRKRSVS